MKKALLFTLFLAIICLITAGCGKQQPANNAAVNPSTNAPAILKVASDATYRPMEWLENGNVVGFDADLIQAIGKEIGKQIVISNVGWDDIFDKLYAKDYDLIMSCVGITDERKNTMIFSDPYFNSTALIVTKKSTNINSAKDLSKKRVAVQSGTTIEDAITKNIAGVSLKKYESAEDVKNSLAKGEADAFVIDAPVAMYFVKSSNSTEYKTVEDKNIFGQEQFGIAANKGQEKLITDINAALAKLKADGEYQKIYDKYFNK